VLLAAVSLFMAIRKEPSGRYRAVVKHLGTYVAGKTFNTRREAEAWEQRQLAALVGGVDLRAGKALVNDLLPEWVAHRQATVAHKTAEADRALTAWIPASMRRMGVGTITQGHIADLLAQHAKSGKARSSLTRFRAVLRSFFDWCVEHRYISANPVIGVRVPTSARPPEEMKPYTRAELDEHLAAWRSIDSEAADLVAFLAATGLRWSEARALTPADVQMVPYPALIVSRAIPESSPKDDDGHAIPKGTKSGKTRRIPLSNDVVPWVKSRMTEPYLAPIRWVGTVHRRLDWTNTADGRTVHDLRHTAITLWLADGLDVGIVRAWAGHADLTTTSRYTHWLGQDADRAALDRLNNARAHRQSGGSERSRSRPKRQGVHEAEGRGARHGHTDTEGREAR
jgi:integrase